MIRFFFLTLLFLLLNLTGSVAHAQTRTLPDQVPGDTVVTLYLPGFAFASDHGLIGAFAINRYRYHPSSSPFVSFAELRVQASTKGLMEARIRYDQTETFGQPVRSLWTLYGERLPIDIYFGLGNDTSFNSDDWNDNYYFYDARRFGLEWLGRKTMFQSDLHNSRLDWMLTANTSYENPAGYDERLMGEDRPVGIDGGWMLSAGPGVIWENRDSEFATTRGNRFVLSGEWAPGLILGDFAMVSIFSEYRQFVTLPIPYLRPVLAGRVAGEWASGDIPYWKRPYVGGERTLRGFPNYRFRGDTSVFYNVELRTWLFEVPDLDFKFGIQGFHDAGRVFYGEDGLGQLFQDYHRTFGGGFATAVFTPDFILRMDIGFSDEMYRLYMNFGYMF